MEPSTVLVTQNAFTEYPYSYDGNWTDNSVLTEGYSASEVISLLVFVVVFLVGVPGNALVVWVTGIEANKMVNSVWFLNLALADLLCCLVLPLLAVPIIRHKDWPFDAITCRILPSIILFNMYTSVLLLTFISIDRLVLVMNPIWSQNHRSVCTARCACFLAWTLALLLTIPSLMYRQLEEEYYPPSWSCGVAFRSKTVEISVAISRFLFSFLGPLIILSICYTLLLNRLWRRQATRSLKTVKVVVAVVVGFFFCWTPYQIVGLLQSLIQEQSTLYYLVNKVDSLTISLAYVNSCINPVIYVVAGHGLKDRITSHSICTNLRSALIEDSIGRDSKSFTRSTMGSVVVQD